MWVRVFPCGCEFPTCTCLRQDEISSPQERWVKVFSSHVGASFPMWVRVFNLHFPDTMKILSPQEKRCPLAATRHRNRSVSPDGAHPTRAENIPKILPKRLFSDGSLSHLEKGIRTAKARLAARGQSPPCPAGHEASVHLKTLGFLRVLRTRDRIVRSSTWCIHSLLECLRARSGWA